MAGALRQLGIEKGDRVIIYMPMVPEAAIAMQACARLGAVHSVVFGGFASNELASRIDDCAPRLIISASCGIEPSGTVPYKPLLDRALEVCKHKPERTIILQRDRLTAEMLPGQDLDWHEVEASAQPVEAVPVASTDPLYIIYTSGTTGQPKGVVRDNGGHLVALNWSLGNIYGVDPGDVFWAASDIGWVVGHSYIVYGPLIRGATAIMFEGKPVGTPDAATYWRLIERHRVKAMFTAPTAIRAIKREDPEGELVKKYDLSSLETLFLAGERADPDTVGGAQPEASRCGPLVANGTGLARCCQLRRHRPVPRQIWLFRQSSTRVPDRGTGRGWPVAAQRHTRRPGSETAATPRYTANLMEQRPGVYRQVPDRVSGVLQYR